jgi:methylphosphotriester-DNA--protein-cysteine methyltransferase
MTSIAAAHWDLVFWQHRGQVRVAVQGPESKASPALRGASADVSERTVQRRFLAATGLTRGTVRQISRARQAAVLIQEGLPVHQVVYRLGYFDQPHLARSLTRYIGRTATQLRAEDPPEPLSLLYKT